MQFSLFPQNDDPPVPDDARPIPGLDGRYYITPDGEVWSLKWRGPRLLKTFRGCSGPRVCLSRFNQRWRPDVSTLLRRTFGIGRKPAGDAQLLRDVLDEYGDHPDVIAWVQSL